jgi:uncharacterized protein YndB with AHSA1/START domain
MAVRERTLKLDISLDIAAPVPLAFAAFFDDAALASWLQTSRSIAVPQILGPYVLEWRSSAGRRDREEGAGEGGIFRATVVDVEPNDHLFLADAFWLPEEGGPLGPLAVQVTFTPTAAADGSTTTLVRLLITGFDDSPRWQRYFALARRQWQEGLDALKRLLEV